jgi:hypothetical protein
MSVQFIKEDMSDEDRSIEEPVNKVSRRREIRPLTTDERAWFVILSFYMAIFGLCTFVYWDSLLLKIIGSTSITGGLILFIAAFFNTEAPEKSHSQHPIRSYLFSLFIALMVLFVIRLVGGFISDLFWSVVVIYGGALAALVIFRKALIQVIATLLTVVFLFVTISNWNAVLVGNVDFRDTVRQCGQAIFRIGPIEDVANLLLAGNYMGYLSRIDYRDEQINIMAIRTVAESNDDDILKARAVLDFVSNEIFYVSDPDDGVEFSKDPITTLIAGGGDCEDQTLLLCSMLESVGVKTYIAFTDDHVFALVRFDRNAPIPSVEPHVFIDGEPCYALDAADPGAKIGGCVSRPEAVKRVFDVRRKAPMQFSIEGPI